MSGWNAYSPNAQAAVCIAEREAVLRNQPVMPEHLLLGILQIENCNTVQALQIMGIDVNAIKQILIQRLPPEADPSIERGSRKLDKRGEKIFEHAYHEARHLHSISVRTEHLLMALLYERWGNAKYALKKNGVRMGRFHRALHELRIRPLPKVPPDIAHDQDSLVSIAVGVADQRWASYPQLKGIAHKLMREQELDPNKFTDQDLAELRAEVTKYLLDRNRTS
ncbi:MAG TPA: Clp protease N-terminal domain-containing protein [Fimbriimonas sp.]|nr:Clp protease N-terminal domain-containing protein [Fimbriimonas sp.]